MGTETGTAASEPRTLAPGTNGADAFCALTDASSFARFTGVRPADAEASPVVFVRIAAGMLGSFTEIKPTFSAGMSNFPTNPSGCCPADAGGRGAVPAPIPGALPTGSPLDRRVPCPCSEGLLPTSRSPPPGPSPSFPPDCPSTACMCSCQRTRKLSESDDCEAAGAVSAEPCRARAIPVAAPISIPAARVMAGDEADGVPK